MSLKDTIKFLGEFITYYDNWDGIPADTSMLKDALNYLQDYLELIEVNGGN